MEVRARKEISWQGKPEEGGEMAKKLRQISCDPACGFMVQSHDEMEVLKMAREHAKKNHKELKVTDAGLKKMMKLV